MRYIKNCLVCILVVLLFSANSVVYAVTDDEENVVTYETEFQNEESKIGETQKVILKFDTEVDAQSVDLDNSYVEIIGGDDEKKYCSLELKDGNYFFKFIIDDSFSLSTEWSLLSIHVFSTNGLEFLNKSKDSFTIVPDAELEGTQVIEDANGNEERALDSDKQEANDFEISDDNLKNTDTSKQNLTLESPSLSNISINQGNGKYTISANISNSVKEVLFPTWSDKNGQDDIKWEAGKITGDTVTYTVDMKDHNYETGIYNTHIYAYDSLGNKTVYGIEKNMIFQNPTIEDVNVVVSEGKYTITAKVTGYDINNVQFATWSDKNGQDDIKWEAGKITGDTVTYTVDMKDHNYETGIYNTHIYAYDSLGNKTLYGIEKNMVFQNPTIKDVNVVASEGRYTITAKVTGYDINNVQFATWSDKNGQDDIKWEAGKITGDTVTYTVDMKDHNYETGIYNTHIYAYDSLGNKTLYGIEKNMVFQNPTIKDVNVVASEGRYTITAKVTGYDINNVQFATWSDKNGQDDIKWEAGKITGDTVTYTVDMKDHNYETGIYNTHIYAYDSLGNKTIFGTYGDIKKTPPLISNVTVARDNGKYIVSAKIEDSYGVSKVLFPTWTDKDGQDDITWEEGTINGDTVTYTVDIKDHKNEVGAYQTHIYAYDKAGLFTVYGISETMNLEMPTISNVSVVNNAGRYTITAKVTGYDINNVQFATWSDKNGQDDIRWTTGKITGDTVTYTVDMKDHNYETGIYNTHIYAYDSLGNKALYGVCETVINEAPKISNVVISDVSSQGYLVTATVIDDYGLDRVLFPTWSLSNGQDDITWGEGIVSGNTVSYRVYIKDHNFDFGLYNTHIYAYDKAGLITMIGTPSVDINSASNIAGWKIENKNKYLYDANGKLVDGSGYLVIDVSEHNGVINWESVRNSGIDGVILRSSYGYDYDNGFSESQMDYYFKRNVAELNRLGIPYGIYHFTYATSVAQGALEAKYTLDCMKAAGAKPTLPIYYDLEYSKFVGDKNSAFYAELTKSYASVIQNAGYQFGVYANYDWWTNKLTDSSFNKYIKWVAHYGTEKNNEAATANPYWHPNSKYKMWQYSSCGRINGISTKVDMNVLLKW